MKKPDSLRAAIAQVLPALARDPERLTISIEKGRLVATGKVPDGAIAAFEYRYTLVLTALDFADDPDLLFTVVLVWIAGNQREILDGYAGGAKDGVAFDVDMLDPHKADIEIRLQLTEAVGVAASAGGWAFTHYPEPPDAERAIAEAAGQDWIETPSPFLQLLANGEPIDP